jgi:hypothetical protein
MVETPVGHMLMGGPPRLPYFDSPLHRDQFPMPFDHVAQRGSRVPPASHWSKAAVWLSCQGARKLSFEAAHRLDRYNGEFVAH